MQRALDDAFFEDLLANSPDTNTVLPALDFVCEDVIRDPFETPPAPFCAERALCPRTCSLEFLRQLPQDADAVAQRLFRH